MSGSTDDQVQMVARMKATIAQLQAELADKQTLVQGMLGCLPGLVYRASYPVGGQSQFDFVSESAQDVAGIDPAELAENAKVLFDRVHPEDRTELIAALARHGDQLCTWRHTFRIVHPHKGLRWQKVVAVPSQRPDGSVEWFGHIEDISDLKRANARLESKNLLLQTLNAAQSHWIERQDIRAACLVLVDVLLRTSEARFACVFECTRAVAGRHRLHVLATQSLCSAEAPNAWAECLNHTVGEFVQEIHRTGSVEPRTLWVSAEKRHALPEDHGQTLAYPLVAHGELMGVLCLAGGPCRHEPPSDDALQSVSSSLSQMLLANRLQLRLHTQSRELSDARLRLTSSNGLTHAALESMTHGMCILDKDGYVVAHNQNYLDLLDLPQELLATVPLHKTVVEFQMQRGDFGLSCDLVSEEARDYVRTNAGWMSSPEKYLRRTRDGRTLEIRSRRLREGGLVRTYTDVTAFQDSLDKLRIERHRLQCALLGSRTGVWEMDVSRGSIAFDHHCCRMLAVSELDERHWDLTRLTHMIHPYDRTSLLRQGVRCLLRSQKFFDVDCRIKKSDGQWCWVHVRGAVVEAATTSEGTVSRLIGTCTDISDRMDLMQKVQFLNEHLKQQVLEKTHTLRCSLDNLETLSFALAHDLRAPIRSIDAMAMLVGENAPADVQPSLRKIQSLAQSMGTMISDMLELIQSGRQSLQREDIDMSQLVHLVIDTVAPLALVSAITVHALPPAYADRTMITHVFINLIDNAIKYAGSRAAPRIEVGFDAKEGAYFVRDHGIGFDMAQADPLFRLFGRLHSTREDIQGSGVGLATCAQMILRHGGKIWASSRVDEGATFWVMLPDQAQAQRDPQAL